MKVTTSQENIILNLRADYQRQLSLETLYFIYFTFLTPALILISTRVGFRSGMRFYGAQ